ncbi:universal stress protein [Caballeronia sp. SBC2]|uniref:universal stress protein n=1 Tax=Caballeronia sp. SBC2 TaxID=2705547 RepID=UPI0013E9EEEC|nr:universal stress protein [Caballeronia sp. SBC2]
MFISYPIHQYYRLLVLVTGFDVLSAVNFERDEQAAREILQEGVNQIREWDVTATGHFATGNPVDQIPRFANSLKIDLIVIGHHPEGFLRAGGPEKTMLCCWTVCCAGFSSRWPEEIVDSTGQ